jgi:ABC-type phosphate/phosphonate transport system substrate-binding protein
MIDRLWFIRIIIVTLLALIPKALYKIVKWKQDKLSSDFKKEIVKQYQNYLNYPLENIIYLKQDNKNVLDNLIELLQENKISKDIFIDLCNYLNNFIDKIRITYIRKLLEKNNLLELFNIYLIDNKFERFELYYLLENIKNTDSINKDTKEFILKTIKFNCISNCNYIDGKYYTEVIHSEKYDKIKQRVKLYLFIGIPVLLLLFEVGYVNRRSLYNPDITIGAMVYNEINNYKDYANKLEDYLCDYTKLNIRIKLYNNYEKISELYDDIKKDKIQCLIINSDMYILLLDKYPDLFKNEMEIFTRHQIGGKGFFKPLFILRSREFPFYLLPDGDNVDLFNKIMNNDTIKKQIKEYLLKGTFAFNNINSIYSYIIPRNYLWNELKITLSSSYDTGTLKSQITGDDCISAMGVVDSKYNIAAVNDALFCKNDFVNKEYSVKKLFYSSFNIPFDSYWIKKDNGINKEYKNRIKDAFIYLDEKKSNKELTVKENEMQIDSWKKCNSEEYFKYMLPLLDLAGISIPKSSILVTNTSDNYLKEDLQKVVKNVKEKLSSINAWSVLDEDKKDYLGEKITVEIKASYRGPVPNYPEYMIKVKVKTINNVKDDFQLDINFNKLIKNENSITKKILKYILEVVSQTFIIQEDSSGIFINRGNSNGINSCNLYIDNKKILKDNYKVEDTKTYFLFNKNNDDYLDLKNKVVKVVYE